MTNCEMYMPRLKDIMQMLPENNVINNLIESSQKLEIIGIDNNVMNNITHLGYTTKNMQLLTDKGFSMDKLREIKNNFIDMNHIVSSLSKELLYH